MKASILKRERLNYLGACIYALSISLPQKITTIGLIMWLILSLLSYRRADLNYQWRLFLLPLLFLSYLLGMLWTGLESESFQFLERKLSLLAFPIIFFLHKYSTVERQNLLKFLIYGLVLSGVLCLAFALNRSLVFQDGSLLFEPGILPGKGFFESVLYGGNHFFGNHFSIFHQTVYYGLYLCVGIAILLFSQNIFGRRQKAGLLIFFAFLLFLLSNKAALITIFMILILWGISLKAKRSKKIIAFLGLAIIASGVLLLNPRTSESIRKVISGEVALNENSRYDFAMRMLSWDASYALIEERPFTGYGLHKAQKALNGVYTSKKYKYPLKESLNSHNQFLQIWIENGMLGLLALIAVFLFLFKGLSTSNFNNLLFISFALILVTNSLFESILSRFSGVSFFSFLLCFIFSTYKNQSSKN